MTEQIVQSKSKPKRTRRRRRQSKTFAGRSGLLFNTASTNYIPQTYANPTQMLDAYRKSPWLRAVVSRIAEMVASTPYTLYRVKSKDHKSYINPRKLKHCNFEVRQKLIKRLENEERLVEVDEHWILDFLDYGSKLLNGQLSRKMTHIYNDLIGNAFWILERSRSGNPLEYWVASSTHLENIDNKTKEWTFRLTDKMVPSVSEDDLVWFKNPDPGEPYYLGYGSAQTLGDEIETDEYASKLLKATMYNKGRIDMIVSLEGASESEINRAQQEFSNKYVGVQNAGRNMFHSGTHKITKISQTLEELAVNDLRAFERDFIIHFYGYPPELLGLIQNSNRATISEARKIRAEEVMIPRLVWEVATIQRDIIDIIDNTLLLGFEDPRPDDEELKIQKYQSSPHTVTINEWRALQGLPNIGPGGDRFAVASTFGITTVTYGSEAPAAEEDDDPGIDDEELEEEEEEEDEGSLSDIDIDNSSDKEAKHLKHIVKQSIKAEEIEAILKVINDPLTAGEVLPLWQERVVQTVSDELARYNATGLFGFTQPAIQAHLEEFAGQQITQINDNTRKTIVDTLVEAAEENLDVKQTAKKIKEVLGGDTYKNRSQVIARTEILRSANTSNLIALETAGFEKKEWVATFDSRTRDSHAALDGVVVDIDKEFEYADGGTTTAPGRSGLAKQDIQCRCTLIPVVPGVEELSADERLEIRKARWKYFNDEFESWESQAIPLFEMVLSKQLNSVLEKIEEVW